MERQYKTATPDMTAAEGVSLILDTAVNTLAGANPPHDPYWQGWKAGVTASLESLLSSEERPAAEILDEEIADAEA